ncbi:MAG: sodium:solute symporter family protein [Spirochaetaceae bacterium]|jgi:SSS family solute:Na+ symporter|nr:sodium:solute symporter family protein [Spirochaetaceae bacterium]
MNTQLVILVVYVLALLSISAWSTQISKKSSGNKTLGYLLAGRNMPVIIIVVMIAGLAIGGASTVGVAESAYTKGFSAGWYNGAWGIGAIIAGLIGVKHYRKMKVKTVPQIMGLMYGEKTRMLAVIAQVLVLLTLTSLQYVAGGAILNALLPNIFTELWHGMLASAAIFIIITVIGGYWASGLTNLFNIVIIYVGVIIAVIQTLAKFGGLESISKKLPPADHWFSWAGSGAAGLGNGVGIVWIVGLIAVMATQCNSNQAVSQVSFASKNSKSARLGFILGGIIILPIGFLCSYFGIAAAAEFPNLKPALALPTIAAGLNPIIGGVFLASLWAADISTAVGLLMGCSTLVMEDLGKKIFSKKLTEEKSLIFSRITVLLISVLAFLLALTVRNILSVVSAGLAITTSFTLIILASIYLPKTCKKAAGFPVILASIVVWIFWTAIPSIEAVSPAFASLRIRQNLQQLVYLEWVVCLLIFVLCAIFGKEKAGTIPKED